MCKIPDALAWGGILHIGKSIGEIEDSAEPSAGKIGRKVQFRLNVADAFSDCLN